MLAFFLVVFLICIHTFCLVYFVINANCELSVTFSLCLFFYPWILVTQNSQHWLAGLLWTEQNLSVLRVMYCIVEQMWKGYGVKPLLFVCLVLCHFYHFFNTAELKLIMSFRVLSLDLLLFFSLCSPASYHFNGLNQRC